MKVVKYNKNHLQELRHEKSVAHVVSYFGEALAETIENAKYSFTGIHDNKVLFCAGVTEYWPGRGEAWAFLDSNSRQHFMAIHNATKRFLEVCPIRRVEAAVDIDFKEGHRWVKLLGFKLEAERLKAYRLDGGDSSLYARVL
jgi:hypothetical protein